MPQMAPMFWTLLMLMFMFIFVTFVAKLYFYLTDQLSAIKHKIFSCKKNYWSW
uniref:ATP synthase 8 n=1 Tax=Proasellus cantabricus TaxID=1281948 RepID=A0A485MEG4_9CRUS|nr:ATP synthase 8 [Proasellus cantabricus]